MIGSCIAFNPCCKCVEKGMCNICELTLYRNGQLADSEDIAPVRHGEWLKTNSELAEMTCSLCGFTYYGEHDVECMSAFCPECGAKMDVEGERKMIKPNDVVLHKPSGEKWVVCGVDYRKGELIPCGYPFPTLAKLSDCELVEEHYSIKAQTEEQIKALREHGLDRFVDGLSAMFHGII